MNLKMFFIGVAFLAVLSSAPALRAFELHAERSSPFDLAVTGRLEGVPAGETRFLRRADLEQLPTRVLTLKGEFVPGEQEVTVVMLNDVLEKLPRMADADALIANCTDKYASIYTNKFMAEYKPFLVLAINGKGPETWPPEGLTFNPGPFVISIAKHLAPNAPELLDAVNKRPWGVDTLEFINYAERFDPWYSGALKEASPFLAEGRDIWVNSCFSCHNAAQHELGGTKAMRPIQILAMHAAFNPEYFKTYVREPKKINPMATMEAYPNYTDKQLDAVIAFLKATMAQ